MGVIGTLCSRVFDKTRSVFPAWSTQKMFAFVPT